MSETKQFKTETKRLLNLMINSIYTNREIFLRELIANASDAIDKYHYLSLTDENLEKRNDYKIKLSLNKEQRTISISDNGIGMTKNEIIEHLGTIAKSGSKEFSEKIQKENVLPEEEREIIGQFGVGFYSSYLVGEKVVVDTLSPYSDKAYKFTSDGIEKYVIEESDKQTIGTSITVYLRPNDDDNDYDQFLEEYMIKSLVKKYSDFIRYPIEMECTKEEVKYDDEGKPTDEYITSKETEVLNSMTPIWRKNKNEVTKEEKDDFYKSKFFDYQEPLDSYLYSVEGNISYTALLFIPKKAPYDLYSDKYEKGLQLYTKGVFIMDKCKELLPDYLRFVKGIVDSSDLSLNISREMLQHDHQLTKIATNLEKKVLRHLQELQNDNPEVYNEFFNALGINLKWGVYNNFGEKKDLLQDLLMYKSLLNDSLISLKDYVSNMKEGQKYIYYASVSSKDELLSMPQMDALKKKEYNVLILTDDVDEFVIQILKKYEDYEFKSVNQGDLDILTDEEKDKVNKLTEEKKPLLEKIKEVLKDKVKDVVLSSRLTDSPVCLVSGDGISFEMEKVINNLPNGSNIKAERILEINPNHLIFKTLEKIQDNKEKLEDYSLVLFNQALILEGFKVENPNELINKMCNIMVNASKEENLE